ncbi:hypothetical protein [Edaphocola aurantiacus]|uniref:hypothetical protein n=1 Tax=Edaphocola aurantiacus TaxID=2601682 RepID=UPI001C97DD7A|nr:hypothetical protein [Edaphocola aurantiacus]
MRIVFIFFILMGFDATCMNAQLLAKVSVEDGNTFENSGTLYYWVTEEFSLDSLCKIKRFSQKRLFEVWGIPISDGGTCCDCFEVLKGKSKFIISALFTNNKSNLLQQFYVKKYSSKYSIQVTFLRVSKFDYCKTVLNQGYFNSINAEFQEMCTITSKDLTITNLTLVDMLYIKEVKRLLNKIKR